MVEGERKMRARREIGVLLVATGRAHLGMLATLVRKRLLGQS